MAAARSSDGPDELAELRTELEQLRQQQHLIAKVTANVAARLAPAPWTEFGRLLSEQFGVSREDAAAFIAILDRRKP